MSDTATNTTDALLKRISELEQKLNEACADAKKRRTQLREEQTAHNELKTRVQGLETENTQLKQSPGEWKTKHDDLQQQLRTRDAADAFKGVLGDTLAPKVTLTKFLAEIGYTPGEVAPTPEEIGELVKQARENVPYLFAPETAETATTPPGGATQGQTRPPLKETLGIPSRGAPDMSASRFTVKRSQLQDPNWSLDPNNKRLVREARQNNTLEVVDG